jgi:3,4-dihydroxy 2-butanone 4-phosphate synthase/GTP cyclohydrolase II
VVYATGHEGRGIGLVAKLRAYMLQDDGDDTLDANAHLGLPIDARDYGDATGVLRAIGVRSVRLLTNNPDKVDGLRRHGVEVDEVVPLQTAPHTRNLRYLRTKRDRFGHVPPAGAELNGWLRPAVDATSLLGDTDTPGWRPYVAVKFAQTLDGRIATASGDSKWISGDEERRVSHALRAACDAVLVGAGTVLADDPRLTVRMVEGRSPIRVVLDSTLRIPLDANVLDDDAHTVVVTTERSNAAKRMAVQGRGAAVEVVRSGTRGVDLSDALRALNELGVRSVLVEGGGSVITSFLGEGLTDRLIVGLAPTVIGAGVEAVGDLRIARVAEGLRLTNREVHVAGDDLLIAGDVEPAYAEGPDLSPASGDGTPGSEFFVSRSRTSTVPSVIRASKAGCGAVAGPRTIDPSLSRKVLPWHGHCTAPCSTSPSASEHPRCEQVSEMAWIVSPSLYSNTSKRSPPAFTGLPSASASAASTAVHCSGSRSKTVLSMPTPRSNDRCPPT